MRAMHCEPTTTPKCVITRGDSKKHARSRSHRIARSVIARARCGEEDHSNARAVDGTSRRGALVMVVASAIAMTSNVDASLARGPADELLAFRKEEEAKSAERMAELYAELKNEEAKALELRWEREGQAKRDLERLRQESERESLEQVMEGKTLCVTPFGIDVVGITEAMALVGAVASGISANQKKEEIVQLNEKLRKINQGLMATSRPKGEVVVTNGVVAVVDEPAVGASVDDWDSLSDDMKELKLNLRQGRKDLRNEDAQSAMNSFKKAIMLSRVVGDLVSLRRATRGLGAAKRMMGDRQGAIAALKDVLTISTELMDSTGDMDALGAIADLYAELGDLENAGRYYDLYLNQMNDETVDIED
jgi:tetratricopeptide (TPR) repeat protein